MVGGPKQITAATAFSSPRGRLSALSRASVPATVSEQMVSAGVAVLWRSGAVEGQLGSDGLLVVEIFRAMIAASCRSNHKAE